MAIVLLLLVCITHAILCLLPGFIIGFFWDINRYKKWLFLFFAFLLSCGLLIKEPYLGVQKSFIYFFEDFFGTYIGLVLLYGFKNMAKRAARFCKICDKFRRKR